MKVVEFSYHFVIQSAFVVKKLKLHLKKFCKLERDGKKENGKKKKGISSLNTFHCNGKCPPNNGGERAIEGVQ